MKRMKLLVVVALALAICLPAVASAYPTVDLYEVAVNNNITTTILAPSYSSNQVQVYTGNYIVAISNPSGSGHPYVQYSGYCVEPVDSVTSPPGLVYEMLPIAALPSTEIPAFKAAAWILSQGYTTLAAAAQVAVWELTWDTALGNPYDLTAGNFQLIGGVSTTDVTSIYNAAIAAAATFDPSGYVIAHNPEGSTGWVYAQDYIIPNPVPVPPSALLLGAGLLGLVGLGWRRRKVS